MRRLQRPSAARSTGAAAATAQGGEARELRERIPQMEAGRGKAQAGIVLGRVGWVGFALFLVIGLLSK